jgi:hypothetical protein
MDAISRRQQLTADNSEVSRNSAPAVDAATPVLSWDSATYRLGSMGRIQVRRRFLCALGCHLRRRWNARNTSRPEQLLLNVILGFTRKAIIELARWTEYQHCHALRLSAFSSAASAQE